MNDIDELGRRAGAVAKRNAEQSIDVGRGLDELRAAGRTTTTLYRVEPDRARGRTARTWIALGSAVAAAAAIVVVLVSRDGRDQRVVPATLPTVVDSTVPATVLTVVDSTVDSTVPASAPSVDGGLKVSYLNPPALIQPSVFASVQVPGLSADTEPRIAVGESGVAILHADGTGVTLLDADARPREMQFAAGVVLSEITLGPADVLYGLTFRDPPTGQAVPDAAMVAIALSGPNTGAVVAEAPLAAPTYVELPAGAFGHGQGGIVDRARFGGQLIGYVDTNGQPLTWTGDPPAEFSWNSADQSTVESTTGASWQLTIERDPQHRDSFVGDPPVALAPGGRGVYGTSIGAAISANQDFSKSTMPVVATLNPDGSAEWALLPDGWQLGASDVWGTLLTHVTNDGVVELAWLHGPDFVTPTLDYTTETLGVTSSCAGDMGCTSTVVDHGGTLVTFDAGTSTLTVHDTPERTINLDIDTSGGAHLLEVTGADVAYLLVSDPGAYDPIGTLYAVSTAAANAGSVVASVGGLDMSGDTDLVAAERGLVSVGCCAFDKQRPLNDAPVVMSWVDATGAPTTFGSAVVQIEFQPDGSADIVRTNPDQAVRRWNVPAVPMMRGMPLLAPLADGGAMAYLSDSFDSTSASRLVVLRPDGTISEHSIGAYVPVAFEPGGTVIVFDSRDGLSRLTFNDA